MSTNIFKLLLSTMPCDVVENPSIVRYVRLANPPSLQRRALQKLFAVLIFAGRQPSTKNAKFYTPRKFPAIR